MRLLVDTSDSIGRRVAALLSDRPGLTVISSEDATSLEPFDRLVSTEKVTEAAVTSRHRAQALVWGADLTGLAVALARTLDAPSLMAVADGAGPTEGGDRQPVRFPDPVGTRDAARVDSPIPGLTLLAAPGVDEWSALRVTGERTLALVDDNRFLAAVILAAAAGLPPGPVWSHHEMFLRDVRRFGLRFAQAVV